MRADARYSTGITAAGGKVRVVRVRKSGYVDKTGRTRDYSWAYLRRTYREAGTVKNETVANLSALPGHVAAVHAMARTLGLPRCSVTVGAPA